MISFSLRKKVISGEIKILNIASTFFSLQWAPSYQHILYPETFFKKYIVILACHSCLLLVNSKISNLYPLIMRLQVLHVSESVIFTNILWSPWSFSCQTRPTHSAGRGEVERLEQQVPYLHRLVSLNGGKSEIFYCNGILFHLKSLQHT